MCYGKKEGIFSVIDKIRKKVIDEEYEFTIPRFFEEMVADDLKFVDIKRVTEEYTSLQKQVVVSIF